MAAAHALLGWTVLVAAVVGGLHARGRIRSGRAYEPSLYRVAVVLVDIQVLTGAAVWVSGRWWEAEAVGRAWLHPAVAILALALGHATVRRADRERWAAEAYRITARGLFALVVVLGLAVAAGRSG